jgi:predicted nucleic acid-binding protein
VAPVFHCGPSRLMTEDLQSGQRIEGVEIVNPFA